MTFSSIGGFRVRIMDSARLIYCLTVLVIAAVRNVRPEPASCGVRKSVESKWPWHVAVLREEDPAGFGYVCAGTLVTRTHVLTVAHCEIDPGKGPHLIVTADMQRHYVKKNHKMENYTGESYRHDIAVLELRSEVILNNYVQVACLLLEGDFPGRVGTLVGWETTRDGESSIFHNEMRLPVVDPITCLRSDRSFFAYSLYDGMVCAGYEGGTEVCEVDAGGGLFFREDGAWHLGGIMSFTNPAKQTGGAATCLTNEYVVFTRIANYIGWIRKVTKTRDPDDYSDEVLSDEEKCVPKLANNGARLDDIVFPRKCGFYTPSHGRSDQLAEYPWFATIRYKTADSHCVGTLLNSRYVLTAASCVEEAMVPYQVRITALNRTSGCSDRQRCEPPVQDIDIECVIQHQDYNKSDHNIALVRLASVVPSPERIQPICLPFELELRDIEVERCVKSTGSSREHIGGPLQHFTGKRFAQLAILLPSVDCDRAAKQYTKVGPYMEWLMANMKT